MKTVEAVNYAHTFDGELHRPVLKRLLRFTPARGKRRIFANLLIFPFSRWVSMTLGGGLEFFSFCEQNKSLISALLDKKEVS